MWCMFVWCVCVVCLCGVCVCGVRMWCVFVWCVDVVFICGGVWCVCTQPPGGLAARVKSPAYDTQSSSCPLQAFEMVAPAQTKFVLFRRVFLCFLPLQEECLPCVRLTQAVEEIAEDPEGLG